MLCEVAADRRDIIVAVEKPFDRNYLGRRLFCQFFDQLVALRDVHRGQREI
jgi:hypothetical protein